MVDTDNKKIIEANARKKYAAKNRPAFQRPERRMESNIKDRRKVNEVVKERKPLSKEEQKELADRIKKEKNPEEKKRLVQIALEHNLKVSEKVLNEIKKETKAREDMKRRIDEMKKRTLSATEKDAVKQIQSGHADRAMKELKASGRDGALGNEIAENSLHMAEDAKIIAKGRTNKDSNSIMKKMLAENSVPADTIYEQKRADKSDQNKEGIRHKDSTQKQMSVAYMKKLRGEAYGG
ncbi:MAG: hypothetical protein IKS41_07010 [Alphaproteobacteria bacterium]|nr:hypothetical protein [Alphaproteobacteria bacterium]